MKVMTVTGPIPSDKLGMTNVHEHILLDLEKVWLYDKSVNPYKRAILDSPVTMDILGILRRDPTICRDNLRLDDDELALKEVAEFKKAGGQTIIDATNKYMGRKAASLKRISESAGLNIIASTGYYIEAARPDSVRTLSIDELADTMIDELTHGMDNTDIKAGMIGEIGTSLRTAPNDLKVWKASAKAHLETGVPIYFHTERPGKEGMLILDTLEKSDVDLGKVVIGHCSDGIGIPKGMDIGYQEAIADRGAYLGYDNFGQEEYYDEGGKMIGGEAVVTRDIDKVNGIVQLVKDGYLPHILLSCDVCWKMHLKTYGGYGFDHVLRNIVPSLKRNGLTQEEVNGLLIDNPRKLFG
jgi:phosphotriesterase-related protein